MRVTDGMMSELARQGLASARSRAATAQRIASSGVRAEQPSDDPAAVAGARRKQAEMERLDAMTRASDVGAASLQVVDDALASAGDLLSRAHELAIQAGNPALNAQDRVMLADEIAATRATLIGIANTRVDGKYVMGGFTETTPPFDPTGAFVGDRNVRQIEVAPGVRAEASLAAGDVFAPVGGTDAMATLTGLEAALRANDAVGIRAAIDPLTTSIGQVSTSRARGGVAMQTMQMAKSLAITLRDRANARRAELVEADPFDALSELARADNALQQAVAIAGRLPLPGLVSSGR